ncbi:hypothetical protein DP113_08950 [Brasilonema octagenarum UFV-E1]|uniref:Uncharacterized protein n=2 Tax=Brasilonema TaxID=383614 RepID=A0A856MEA8_9CYAN|nr:hypothetical protein [Brasilonema octagenarum UFV-OR1]QDL08021.1 hypothetical protein DP114_08995 [Brasilonema sennae CENA114]QDL14380.1 hypothetical protein DP113_08950 [Brasilonema octagenarum UFV-E1]
MDLAQFPLVWVFIRKPQSHTQIKVKRSCRFFQEIQEKVRCQNQFCFLTSRYYIAFNGCPDSFFVTDF